MLTAKIFGVGAPIVLLPGFRLDADAMAAMFEPVFTRAAGRQRIYLDLPGTGGSAPVKPTSDAVLDSVQETVLGLTGDGPLLVVGHSYGGYLAAGLARRLPGRIGGLLLICSGVKIERGDRNLSGISSPAPEPGWLADVPTELHDHFDQAIGHQRRAVATRLAEVLALRGPMQEEYLALLQSDGYRLSDEGSVQVFEGRVRIVAGRRDRIGGYLDQFDALSRYPRGDFVLVGEAGHYLPLEQPGILAANALDWLGGEEPE